MNCSLLAQASPLSNQQPDPSHHAHPFARDLALDERCTQRLLTMQSLKFELRLFTHLPSPAPTGAGSRLAERAMIRSSPHVQPWLRPAFLDGLGCWSGHSGVALVRSMSGNRGRLMPRDQLCGWRGAARDRTLGLGVRWPWGRHPHCCPRWERPRCPPAVISGGSSGGCQFLLAKFQLGSRSGASRTHRYRPHRRCSSIDGRTPSDRGVGGRSRAEARPRLAQRLFDHWQSANPLTSGEV